VSQSDTPSIQRDLLSWFQLQARDLPWRRTRNPYHIWVSEIMLQQTQVATVIPYYERFLAQFPTIKALAEAPQEQVLKAWEGLGYYSRGRNLHAGAIRVLEAHSGAVPDTWKALKALPGIGDYTAGAISSIAFGLAVPAVDGNVMRVLARWFLIQEDIALLATKRRIDAIAQALVPQEVPGAFNEALMELGATVCVPSVPRCGLCPMTAHCRAFAAGLQGNLPIKAKKTALREVTLAVALISLNGRHLIVRRPNEGIWAGLWGFPTFEASCDEELGETLTRSLEAQGLAIALGKPFTTLHHTLTHRRLTLKVYEATYLSGELTLGQHAWVSLQELDAYALPVPFRKLAKCLELNQAEARV
jgi:A/G-specific adenine glycosylase